MSRLLRPVPLIVAGAVLVYGGILLGGPWIYASVAGVVLWIAALFAAGRSG